MQEYAHLTNWTECKGLLHTPEMALQIMWKGGHFQQIFMEQLVTHMKKSVWMHIHKIVSVFYVVWKAKYVNVEEKLWKTFRFGETRKLWTKL